MEKDYNPVEYNNAVQCEVCGQLTFADDYGNTDKCPHCGWMQSPGNELLEQWQGISYPMLVPLSRAREQYKAGQKFKATFEDFINGLKFYAEMLFWHGGTVYTVCRKSGGVRLSCKDFAESYETIEEFYDHAHIGGRLLKDIWVEVVHPCYMYCGDPETDYEVSPQD